LERSCETGEIFQRIDLHARSIGHTVVRDRRLLVLYDADCRFCSRSARVLRWLDHGGRLHLLPIQAAGNVADAPSRDLLLEAIHVRDQGGRWSVAGAAWIRIGQEITVLRPLALLAGVPLIRRFVEWAYARVAGNRRRLSRLLGDDVCPIEPRTP
jgi:predicted DCC family thiol-disulfide oxidoreductase YuxK